MIVVLFGWLYLAVAAIDPVGVSSSPQMMDVDAEEILVGLAAQYENMYEAKNESFSGVIVVFSDFGCSFCKKYSEELATVRSYYQRRVPMVFVHVPLYPEVQYASEVGVCAQQQGAFWDFEPFLFRKAAALEEQDVIGYASEIGLDTELLQECLSSGIAQDQIAADMELARISGIAGTPTTVFVAGKKVYKHEGMLTTEEVISMFEQFLLLDE